jgi:hypothetical protein
MAERITLTLKDKRGNTCQYPLWGGGIMKYKDAIKENKFVVVADYQPGSMWSRPEDRKTSRHKTCESVFDKIEEHKKNGASGIEVMQIIVSLQRK